MNYSYLLITIPMILSVLTGLAVVFWIIPRWVFRGQIPTPRNRTAVWFAIAGFLVSCVFVTKYALTRTEIVSMSMWVWPASIGLAALDPPGSATIGEALLIYGIAILSNIGLYSWLGLLVGTFSAGKTRMGNEEN
jgi:hypothetical protein